jgi:hypothetical protein
VYRSGFEDYDKRMDGWKDGGSDAKYSTDADYSTSGNGSIRIRDNTSSSNIEYRSLDASNCSQVSVSYSYHTKNLNIGHHWDLKKSENGGSSWTDVKIWEVGEISSTRGIVVMVSSEDHVGSLEDEVMDTANIASSDAFQLRFEMEGRKKSDRLHLDNIELKCLCEPELCPAPGSVSNVPSR